MRGEEGAAVADDGRDDGRQPAPKSTRTASRQVGPRRLFLGLHSAPERPDEV